MREKERDFSQHKAKINQLNIWNITIEISAAKYWPKYSQTIQSLKKTFQKFRNKRFFHLNTTSEIY